MSNPEQFQQASTLAQQLRAEIQKAVIGQRTVIDQVLIGLLAAGHVMVEGVPGLGKTLLVRALAGCFNAGFGRIQFTPDLMPADVTGHVLYDMNAGKFKVRKGPVFTNLLLADEINRAPAKTQAALLEVMQEGQVTLEGNSLEVPQPFLVLATQNPIEQEGTYPLPEAQLDRYLLKVLIDYPAADEELDMIQQISNGKVGDGLDVSAIQQVANAEQIMAMQAVAASLRVDEAVARYAVDIARQTRNWPGISAGAGPRGGLALLRAARAQALLNGRDFVIPDDIKEVTLPALRHRITLSPEMELEGQTPDQILFGILDHIAAPRT